MPINVVYSKEAENYSEIEQVKNKLEQVQPHLRFLLSLNLDRMVFLSKLFISDSTLYILSDDNADDIRVVTSDPSTANMYEYSKLYTDFLLSGVDNLEFMVNGEHEIDDRLYNIKITREEWYAFNR